MEMQNPPMEMRWRQAIETGELGVWDLRLDLETVQYSPQWKQRFGFPEPHGADSTHFWRCRVHPEDLAGMMAAIRRHAQGSQPDYEARFRLRSNGSGYRSVHSRGRVIERSPEGRALRMVGTMIDLTQRAPTPSTGLPEGPRGVMAGRPLSLPFHLLLSTGDANKDAADARQQQIALERDRVLSLVTDLLRTTVAQLEGLDAL
ncbi:PAS domain-containing protein [Roseateles sp. NT4]|uniref:PAS domain-containing protein n=1 Tax=Roseateles sp. NT4 TaxID=3453715 RepID=UPI003EEC4720